MRLRERIRTGRYSREGLRQALERHAGPAGPAGAYDALDSLFAGLFVPQAPGPERQAPEPERVFYQPTPARSILHLIDGLGPQDHLLDLGSGLGVAVQAAALLAGTACTGVEVEDAYHERAELSAEALGLRQTRFVQGDARQVPWPAADVIFLYTPFRGGVLEAVLERIQALPPGRPSRLVSFGPLSRILSQRPWLEREPGPELSDVRLQTFHRKSALK